MLQGCDYDDKCNSISECHSPGFSYEWDSSHPCLSLVTFKNNWCMHGLYTMFGLRRGKGIGKGQGQGKQNIFP
jgi:hypothetical protein